MASLELDPTFSRALRLLHSKTKDSEEQLRSMLDEAIKQRHGNSKTLANIFIKKEVSSKRESSKTTTSTSSGRKDELRKESEKKSFDKIEESTKCFSSRNTSPAPSQHDDDDDDDDFALEILEEDLTCVVCRGMDVVARNQLVECIECHSLYHQECHQPPVAEADMNDPRSAWYCSNCTKAVMKIQGTGKQVTTGGTQCSYNSTGGKPAFSVIVPKVANTSPTFNSASKSFGGLSLPPLKTKSSAVSVSSQKCVIPNINIISADKRLQIMKKKAAKMQEKRKHSK